MIPAPLGRLAYRCASLGLRIWSLVVRPHTRGVKCLVYESGELLVVRHSYGPRRWDLPGGFVRGDEDWEAAAHRELAEELTLGEGARFTDLGELRRRYGGRHETLRGFRVDLASRDPTIRGFEVVRIAWCDPTALPERRAEVVDDILALERRFVAD